MKFYIAVYSINKCCEITARDIFVKKKTSREKMIYNKNKNSFRTQSYIKLGLLMFSIGCLNSNMYGVQWVKK